MTDCSDPAASLYREREREASGEPPRAVGDGQDREWMDLGRGESNTSFNRARQLYKHISMLFLFSVKDGKLSTGVNATFNASCYG